MEHGDFAVALLDDRVAGVIGARSKVVRLSGRTAEKQRRRHRLEAYDHARVQRILDEGELFADGNGVIGFIEEDGRLWRAIVRTFNDGSETYLNTLHRARLHDLRAARRQLSRIERGDV